MQLTEGEIPEELAPIAKIARQIVAPDAEQKFYKLYQTLLLQGYRHLGVLPTTLRDFAEMARQFQVDCDDALCKIAYDGGRQDHGLLLTCNPQTCGFTASDTNAQKAAKVRIWLQTHGDALREETFWNLNDLRLRVLPPEIAQYFSRATYLLLNNNQLRMVDLQNLTALVVLSITNNQIHAIDLHNQPFLEELHLSNNSLQTITLRNMPSLRIISILNNKLPAITLEDLPALEILGLWKNQLQKAILKDLPALHTLDLSNNQLQSINLENLIALTFLYLENNQLKTIDLENLPALVRLSLADNQLEAINLQSIPLALQILCHINRQHQWDGVQTLRNLRYLNLANNLLQEIDLQDLCELESLNLANNPLKSVDLWNQTLLRFLELPVKLRMELLAKHAEEKVIPSFVKALFYDISQARSNALDKKVWELAGSPDTPIPDWGLQHRYDDAERFYRALPIDDETKDTFHEYDTDTKNRVYRKVWELAGRPEGDPWWGEHHVFHDAYFFYSALGQVLYPKSSSCTLL
ncbi:MAG: hypothetical protein JSS61_00480 [Verrucomicrobia bacterium]|nr:hypothetical protein [Verrucomicrobiota bacterium]